jgi:hypothetical protein
MIGVLKQARIDLCCSGRLIRHSLA